MVLIDVRDIHQVESLLGLAKFSQRRRDVRRVGVGHPSVDENSRLARRVGEEQAVTLGGLKHRELHQPRSFLSFLFSRSSTSSKHASGYITPKPASLVHS